MFYVYGVNLEGDKTNTIEKNADGMTASKEVSLEIHTESTLLSRHKNAGKTHDIKIVNTTYSRK
jgi:hypothetical protein